MNKLLQKALLFIFLCSSPVSAASSAEENEYPSLEALFIKKNRRSGGDYVQDTYKRFDILLKAVKKDDYKEFLASFDNMLKTGSGDTLRDILRLKEVEMVCRLPLRGFQSENRLEPKEVVPITALEAELNQNRNFNLLQFAIKKRACNVVHALLLRNVQYDVNRLDNTQNMGKTQQDDTDLLMLAVTNMNDEKSLKILAMLIAAGVTCGNSKYPPKGETPLTQLMKQLNVSEEVRRKGILILINAGFDPYEERFESDKSPFIQVVAKEDNDIIATSVACFGKEHEKDTFLNDGNAFREKVNDGRKSDNYLTTTDSYKSIIERASGSLKDAEASIESIRIELLKDRKDIVEYFTRIPRDLDLVHRLFANDSYLKLAPKGKQDLLQMSIDKLKKIKEQVEAAAKTFKGDTTTADNLHNEISRRWFLLGHSAWQGSDDEKIYDVRVNYFHLNQESQEFCNTGKGIPTISYEKAIDLTKEIEASDGNVNRLQAFDKITTKLEEDARYYISRWKEAEQAKTGSANAPQPSDTPQQALGQSGSQVGQNSSLHNPSQTLSTSTPQPGSQLQAPGSKNSPPVSQPVTQHKDETAGEDPLTRRSFAQYAGIGLAVGGVALTLFLLMKKLRSHEDNESESEDDEIKQRHAHGKYVSRS